MSALRDGGDDEILVTARELRDCCYRAMRTGGASDGQAKAVARAAAFALGALDVDVAPLLLRLEGGELPVFGLPLVLRIETGEQAVRLPDGCVLSDLAYFAVDALRRGCEIAMVTAEGVSVPTGHLLDRGIDGQLVRIEPATPSGAVVVEQTLRALDSRMDTVDRSGVLVHRHTWHGLEKLASRYLVPEAIIDASPEV